MPERVVVRQNERFEIEFRAVTDPEAEDNELESVAHIHALTPHGMMLVSLGACTTSLLHSYALHHNIDLPWVEVEAVYRRISGEECEECEGPNDYREKIIKTLRLPAELDEGLRERLYKISHQCSIQHILEHSIDVTSQLGGEQG